MKFCIDSLCFVQSDIDRDKLAICGSDRDLTWGEFEHEVEILKQKLEHIKSGHPVIIYGHKESMFVISITTCMMLSLPYVPIDTLMPESRVHKIKNILNSSVTIYCNTKEIRFSSNEFVALKEQREGLFYIIFTSGSTGEPKGVMITKEAVLDYTNWIKDEFGFKSSDVFVSQIPFSFDLSTYELFSFLMFGASLVVLSRHTIEKGSIAEKLKSYNCNIWNSTPSFIKLSLREDGFNSQNLPSLERFFIAGEELKHRLIENILARFNGVSIYNSYGPTELTNTVTLVKIDDEILRKYKKYIPVGYAKKSSEIFLENIQRVDDKDIGEIVVVGKNVSIGYINAKNEGKFFVKDGRRGFKTGDYGFFEDGMLFFYGRSDSLIKLHGYRVDLREIDSLIELDIGVKDSITLPLKNRESQIVRVVSFIKIEKNLDKNSLKNRIITKLKDTLPYYMIPSDMAFLDDFIYSSNNKVDTKTLIKKYQNGTL